MDSVFATEKASLVNNIALIDGFTRSGKFFLAKIVSGLNKIEFFQYIHVEIHHDWEFSLHCDA